MLKPENYFDNAATTPVDPRVIREMLPYFETHWGNANSLHAWGSEAIDGVELARHRVIQLLGDKNIDSSQVIFTSGATESNNWVLGLDPDTIVGPFEHSSVYETAKLKSIPILGNRGLEIILPERQYAVMSLMDTNNEIGTRWHWTRVDDTARLFHRDITQSLGKLSIDLTEVSFASASAHKFYGPKGVGILYWADGPPAPMIAGGEQECGLRAGTLNVPGIVGMGAAAAIAMDEGQENLAKTEELRAIVLEALRPCKDYQVNGGDNVSPYILSVSFLGVEGETLVIEMDQAGYAISSGAACSSRSTDPSHVLTALKMPEEWLRGTIRISFGRTNTKEAASAMAKHLVVTVERLRKLRTI